MFEDEARFGRISDPRRCWAPAGMRPEVAVQMWNRSVIPGMVSRLVAGQSIKQAMDWASTEIEGFRR